MAKGYSSKRKSIARKKSPKVNKGRRIYHGTKTDVKAYQRQRSRIKRQIKSMRERGYDVPESILPDIPKRITKGSVNRLKKITSGKIYAESAFITDAETGEGISGYQQRYKELKEIRKEAGKRGAETRRRHKLSKKRQDYYESIGVTPDADGYYDLGDVSLREKELETEIEQEPEEGETYYPDIGDLMYQRLLDMINKYGKSAPAEAAYMKSALYSKSESEVKQALVDNAKDIDLEELEQEMKYASSTGHPVLNSAQRLHEVIVGHPMTSREWQSLRDAREDDEEADDIDYQD